MTPIPRMLRRAEWNQSCVAAVFLWYRVPQLRYDRNSIARCGSS
jgi:hypothetical protein